MANRKTAMIAVVILVCGVRMAAAQVPLREVIPTMLGPGMTIAPGPSGTHANDFARAFGEPDFVFFNTFGTPPLISTDVRGLAFNGAIVEQLTRFPIGSSSGGFLYTFDPALGTFRRSSRSFGTSYGERPLTSGRRTLSAGFAYQSIDFSHFDETALDGGDIRFVYAHKDLVAGAPVTPERSDVMVATLRLKIQSRVALTTFTYGVTDRLDVSVTIPLNRTTLDVSVEKEILRLGTSRADPPLHSFADGTTVQTSTGGGTVSGLGDVRVAAKYNVLRRRNFALAVLQDFRLPTGDDRNLLGTGALISRTLGVVSAVKQSLALNVSIGATFVAENRDAQQFVGTPSNELNQTFGVDYVLHPRVTVSFDLVGHTRVNGSVKMGPGNRPVQVVTAPGGPIGNQALYEFQINEIEAKESPFRMVVGAKANAWRNLLLVGNVLFGKHLFGLTHTPVLSFGAEYTF